MCAKRNNNSTNRDQGRTEWWTDGEATIPSPPSMQKKECPPLSLACNAWVSKWTDVPISNPPHRSNSNSYSPAFLFCFVSLFLLQPTTVMSLTPLFFWTSQARCVDKMHPLRGNYWDSYPSSSFSQYLIFYLRAEGMPDLVLSISLSRAPRLFTHCYRVQNVDSLSFLVFFLVEWVCSLVPSWYYLAFTFLLIMLAHSPSLIPFLHLSPSAVPISSMNTNRGSTWLGRHPIRLVFHFIRQKMATTTAALTRTTKTHVARQCNYNIPSLFFSLVALPLHQSQKPSSKH